jgi:hypothetical protein
MKAILEFNLPEDQSDYIFASKGYEFWECLWDINNEMRSIIKHDDKASDDVVALAEKVREMIYNNVDIYCVE